MYNKVVTTLVLLLTFVALSGTVHAQYYTQHYGPVSTSYGFLNSQYQGTYSQGSLSYFGQRHGPVFGPPAPRTPSSFVAAYNGLSFAPDIGVLAPRTPSTVNFNFRPVDLAPAFGPSPFTASTVNINLRPVYTQPDFGPSGFFRSSINLNLARRELPPVRPFELGAVHYSLRNNIYTVPIYATPSRSLFNTEFGFGAYWNPYLYYW